MPAASLVTVPSPDPAFVTESRLCGVATLQPQRSSLRSRAVRRTAGVPPIGLSPVSELITNASHCAAPNSIPRPLWKTILSPAGDQCGLRSKPERLAVVSPPEPAGL